MICKKLIKINSINAPSYACSRSSLRILFLILSSLFIPLHQAQAQDSEIKTQQFSLAPKRAIPYSILGVSAFVNDQRFGTIRRQLYEVKKTLKISHVRLLFRWDDNVQPTPTSQPNFAFYDDIVRNIPRGMRAIVVLTGVPSWMKNSAHWVEGNPRTTFNQRWIKTVVSRYAKRQSIIGWQIWNEPNMVSDEQNVTLNLAESPENYLELLSGAYQIIKQSAPRDKVIAAATTAINQNFPATLNYNKALKEAGIEQFCDIWTAHYYSEQYERFLFLGIAEFMNQINKPIWITESGAQGVNSQLAYGQRTWPLLRENVAKIARIYIYQFTESTDAQTTYGLKNLTPGLTVSDLYINLRDRR
jgi:hypothetical protein